MGLRRTFEKVIGIQATKKLVFLKKKVEWACSCWRGTVGTIAFSDNRPYRIYHIDEQNVFFGYYDLQQYDKSGRKLLAHIVKSGADPAIDPARLVLFCGESDKPCEITQTRAWCWQQGARLRWHPTEPDTVLYNDVENGEYVAKQCKLDGSGAKTVSRALYDVDAQFKNGLCLNFARLQRLRPGYGYSVISDQTVGQAAPDDDGVFLVDMESGQEKLLFSLRELAEDVSEGFQHYINHISISPSGKRFSFFHLWTSGAGCPWSMRFYVASNDGTGLLCLEDQLCISHYTWLDDTRMLTTTTDGRYILYGVTDGKKQVLDSEHLDRDGHPSGLRTGFLSDTYPQKDHMQHVFRIGMDGSEYREILRVFSDPRRYDEHRCDLHPRVTADGQVVVDTTCLGDVRSMLAFDLTEEELGREK